MRWFGYKSFALVCDHSPRAETPIGEACVWCEEPIGPEENGFLVLTVGPNGLSTEQPIHPECHLRTLVGGANHQAGLCVCFGGELPSDSVDLSLREAAEAAAAFYMARLRWH